MADPERDDFDLQVLMSMIEKYATFVAREHDGKERAAQFYESVAKACAEKAAEYRK
jgi:hypothetical protein